MRRLFLSAIAGVSLCGGADACPASSSSASVELFPTATVLPENLLRLYVYFPRPMGPGVEASDIKLLDADGREIEQAFLPTRFGLWSPDRSRLTVLLDPGRVKTGLTAHDAFGRVLVPGRRYSIKVPGRLIDADGCKLGDDTLFAFTAGHADLQRPSPSEWRIIAPPAASKSALRIDLGSPHDHLSLAYRLRVVTTAGETVAGKITLADHERVWQFTPRSDWSATAYRIVIDARLEDLAGNRPGALFDQDIGAATSEWVRELSFTPAAAPNE